MKRVKFIPALSMGNSTEVNNYVFTYNHYWIWPGIWKGANDADRMDSALAAADGEGGWQVGKLSWIRLIGPEPKAIEVTKNEAALVLCGG